MPTATHEQEEHTFLPPAPDTPIQRQLEQLAQSFHGRRPARLVGSDGTATELPEEIYSALREVVTALLEGKAITIAPHTTMLTTQQAADMIGISRPTLVKLLEGGEIPFSQPGRHRRIQLADLMGYRDRSRAVRREALRELTQSAEEDGLYEAGTGFI